MNLLASSNRPTYFLYTQIAPFKGVWALVKWNQKSAGELYHSRFINQNRSNFSHARVFFHLVLHFKKKLYHQILRLIRFLNSKVVALVLEINPS